MLRYASTLPAACKLSLEASFQYLSYYVIDIDSTSCHVSGFSCSSHTKCTEWRAAVCSCLHSIIHLPSEAILLHECVDLFCCGTCFKREKS